MHLARLMHGDRLSAACIGDLAALGVHFDKPRRAPAMIRRDGRRGFAG